MKIRQAIKQAIGRPTDPYDPAWPEYWKQNPGVHKGVGAAAEGDAPTLEQLTEQLQTLTEQVETLTGERDTLQQSVTKLEENNASLLGEKKKADKAAKDAADEAARKSGDLSAIDASWQGKLDAQTEESGKRISSLESMVRTLTVGSNASSIATAIAVDAESVPALIPHIEKRLSVDMTGDSAVLRVLDANGAASALTVPDLQKEFSENPAFARLVKASSASGAGGPSKDGKGGTAKTAKRSEFNGWDQGTRAEFFKNGGTLVEG